MVASIFAALSSLLICTAESETRPPNVVVILADDLGYGDIQAYNARSSIPTPNLDRLCADGVRFTDAHSPSAVCTPTRYGLLTGRYCWRTRLTRGVLGGYSPPLLKPDRSTIASMLANKGYRTGAFGKWHLGMALPMREDEAKTSQWSGDPGVDFGGTITDSPIHHGFSTYFGVAASLDMAPYVFVRDDRFTMKPTLQQPAVPFPHFVRRGPRAKDFVIDEVLDRLADEAVRFLRDAKKESQPFFMYMPLTGPHKPTQPHARFQGKTGLGEYGDFVTQVDWTVGKVLDTLDSLELADETLVFFTSDNGSYMYRYEQGESDHVDDEKRQGYRVEHHQANGALRGTKADIWEAGHRVPLIARWPGQTKRGTTCDATVCLTDLYATCAAVVEHSLSDNEAEDSLSLVPMLKGDAAPRAAPVIHHSGGGMFAIRSGRWKLVAGNGSGGRQQPRGKPFAKPYQLFDIEADTSETRDVAADNPEVVQQLAETLDRIRDAGRSR